MRFQIGGPEQLKERASQVESLNEETLRRKMKEITHDQQHEYSCYQTMTMIIDTHSLALFP